MVCQEHHWKICQSVLWAKRYGKKILRRTRKDKVNSKIYIFRVVEGNSWSLCNWKLIHSCRYHDLSLVVKILYNNCSLWHWNTNWMSKSERINKVDWAKTISSINIERSYPRMEVKFVQTLFPRNIWLIVKLLCLLYFIVNFWK